VLVLPVIIEEDQLARPLFSSFTHLSVIPSYCYSMIMYGLEVPIFSVQLMQYRVPLRVPSLLEGGIAITKCFLRGLFFERMTDQNDF
jgi:hypothetical protein